MKSEWKQLNEEGKALLAAGMKTIMVMRTENWLAEHNFSNADACEFWMEVGRLLVEEYAKEMATARAIDEARDKGPAPSEECS